MEGRRGEIKGEVVKGGEGEESNNEGDDRNKLCVSGSYIEVTEALGGDMDGLEREDNEEGGEVLVSGEVGWVEGEEHRSENGEEVV